MTLRYFQHNNMVLDLNGKRISKKGIDIINIENTASYHFSLRYLSENGTEHYKNRIHLDKDNKKTLELYISSETDIADEESFIRDLKNSLIISRRYADNLNIDLLASFSSNLNYYIANCILKKNNGCIFPMLYSELCQVAENNMPVTIRPSYKDNNRSQYILPDRLKANILLEDNSVDDIDIKIKSKSKTSYDLSNLNIHNNNCEDKSIEINMDDKAFYEKDIENTIKDIDFKPPVSTCIEDSYGRNHFLLHGIVGLLSREALDIFYNKNRLSVIKIDSVMDDFLGEIEKCPNMTDNKKDYVKNIINNALYINEKNKENDKFLTNDSEKIRSKLQKCKDEIDFKTEPHITNY